MNRKLKKLIKTPRQYFVDLIKKRLAKGSIPIKNLPWFGKVSGNHKYSVVCAVYGVEPYIEQFFTSIENQTLDFVEHIELIMVDDGSLDGSAEIIKRWSKKYPKNIFYISKENGGQASARNLGVESASHEWVTFIDPDDFVDMNYFAEVDRFLSKECDIDLVSCNFIFYMEDTDRFTDSHPMKYRFSAQEKILSVDNMGKHLQLSVNSAFFRKSIIIEHSLMMGEKIKPAFEDAHFANKYLLLLESHRFVGFIRDAKYYYRKRVDSSSTLDSAWLNPLHYSDKLEFGSLDLLRFSDATKGYIPEYIQRTVLYDYFWYIRYIVNNSERLSFLSKEERDKFLSLSHEIFSLIDVDVINNFDLAGCWLLHKVGILGFFKGVTLPFQIVYVENYDPVKNLVQLKYYYSESILLESIKLDGEEVIPAYVKTREYDFLSETFVKERIIWVTLGESSNNILVSIGDIETLMTFAGKQYKNGISIESITNHFVKKELNDKNFPQHVRLLRKESSKPIVASLYSKCWIFMDRDTNADDNAEHLYRYVVNYHPDINVFFVLRNTSHDWSRLEDEGFRLLNFNSRAHKLALLNAEHVISSHVDHYVISLLEGKWYSDLLKFNYTFLQHGVIQNDLSNWLNAKAIDMFVTATQQEFNSIAGSANRYKFTPREVSLTGLPRHDALLKLNDEIETENLIVIMPTWRQGIVGNIVGQGNDRDLNDEFYISDYAQAWRSFLHSSELKEKTTASDYKVVFFPHTNIQPYLQWFDTPEYIEIVSNGSIRSMQDLFCRASILVTDYSSVAFEMAYINKFILYYQFDYDFVFGGGHTTSKGYYDYESDGFGPVCFTEVELLSALNSLLPQNVTMDEKYLARIDNTFYRRDGSCCKRVYEAIRRLNNYDADTQQGTIAIEYANKATTEKSWILAANRWEALYSNIDRNSNEMFEIGLNLARTCRYEGKNYSAKVWLECLEKNNSEALNSKYSLSIKLEWVKLLMASNEWDDALVYLKELKEFDRLHSTMYQLVCLGYLNRSVDIEKELAKLNDYKYTNYESSLIDGWKLAANNKWDDAVERWSGLTEEWEEDLYLHRVILLANVVLKKPTAIFEALNTIRKITKSSKPVLLDNSMDFSQALHISLVEEWGAEFSEMSAIDMANLIRAYRLNDQIQEAKELLMKAVRYYPQHVKIRIEIAEMFSLEDYLDKSVVEWKSLLKDYGDDLFAYKLAAAYSRIGSFDQALALLLDESGSISVKPGSSFEWELLVSLAKHSTDEITLRALSHVE